MQEIINKFTIPYWETIWMIVFITVVMMILILIVGAAVRKADPRSKPSRLVEFTCYFCGGMKNLVEQNIGKRFLWLGPYLVFLMTFFLTAVAFGMLGFPVVMTNIAVPLSLGIVMFILIWSLSIRDHKIGHFKKFINPINLVGEVAPIISMSFRIFGNIVAGGIILALLNISLGNVWTALAPTLSKSNILGGLVTAPLRLYFDVFSGLVQAYIFTLLTAIYIGLSVKSDDDIQAEIENKNAKESNNKPTIKLSTENAH